MPRFSMARHNFAIDIKMGLYVCEINLCQATTKPGQREREMNNLMDDMVHIKFCTCYTSVVDQGPGFEIKYNNVLK